MANSSQLVLPRITAPGAFEPLDGGWHHRAWKRRSSRILGAAGLW